MVIHSRKDLVIFLTFPPAWMVRLQTGSIPCHCALSTISRRWLRHSSPSMPLAKKSREVAIIFSPLRWGNETVSSRTSTFCKPAYQSLQLWWRSLHARVHQRIASHTSSIKSSWSTMSPRWARSFFELSLTSIFKRRWRLPPITPQNQAMVGKSRSLRTKLSTTLKIDTGDKLLTRFKHSRFCLYIHSETIDHWNTSVHWSSRSTRSLTPSKTSPGLDARDQSNTIPHFPGQKNIIPTMTAKGTKLSIVGPSEGT